MKITQFCIENRVTTLVLTVVLVVGGIISYGGMGRLEDPEFTIKDALIITPYPGASAAEVEEEVSDVIETAVQKLKQLLEVESRSTRGLSIVTATIKDRFDKETLPQVWDELRRKVNDAQRELPPGAGPSIVNDDFGDVYGVFFALYGEGYSYAELYETAKLLRRELLLVQDVAKIDFFGMQPEVVYVELDRDRMSQLGISMAAVAQGLRSRNLAAYAGHVEVGPDFITIDPTGLFDSVDDFRSLVIAGDPGGAQIYLRDIATIRRGYRDPAKQLIRYNGMPAVGLGISTVPDGNVVTMGDAVGARFRELLPQIESRDHRHQQLSGQSAAGRGHRRGGAAPLHGAQVGAADRVHSLPHHCGLVHHHAAHGRDAGAHLPRCADHRARDARGQRHRGGGRDAGEAATGSGQGPRGGRHGTADGLAAARGDDHRGARLRGDRHVTGRDG
jgi:multidrug efflux pump subunit AcrB